MDVSEDLNKLIRSVTLLLLLELIDSINYILKLCLLSIQLYQSSFAKAFDVFSNDMLDLLGMRSMVLKSTLVADHDFVLSTEVLSNNIRMALAENPKYLILGFEHSVHVISELLWNYDHFLVNWADQLAFLRLH